MRSRPVWANRWAWRPEWEQGVRLAVLQSVRDGEVGEHEAALRSWLAGEASFPLAFLDGHGEATLAEAQAAEAVGGDGELAGRLARVLRVLRELRCYLVWQERQRQVCGTLGLAWPRPGCPDPDPAGFVGGEFESAEDAAGRAWMGWAGRGGLRRRGWAWCWEGQRWLSPKVGPVVVPHDWSPAEGDAFGVSGRWSPGSVLVVPLSELPGVSELAGSLASERERVANERRRAGRVGPGDDEGAEVVRLPSPWWEDPDASAAAVDGGDPLAFVELDAQPVFPHLDKPEPSRRRGTGVAGSGALGG